MRKHSHLTQIPFGCGSAALVLLNHKERAGTAAGDCLDRSCDSDVVNREDMWFAVIKGPISINTKCHRVKPAL